MWRKILHFVAIPPTTINFISKINKLIKVLTLSGVNPILCCCGLINAPQFAYIKLEALLSIKDARALLGNRIMGPKSDIEPKTTEIFVYRRFDNILYWRGDTRRLLVALIS